MVGGKHHRGRNGEHGQATVEFALVLPVAVLFALVAVQLALVAKDVVLVHHAAREGARAAAVEPSAAVAREAAAGSSSLDVGRLSVTLAGGSRRGDRTTATVIYRSATNVPIVGALIPDVTVSASATMRVE